GALEVEEVLGDAGGLEHGTVTGEVALEHGQAAVLGVGVRDGADHAVLAVGVELVPGVGGGERLGGAHPAGGGVEEGLGLLRGGAAADVPFGEPAGQVRGVDGVDAVVQQPGPVELAEDRGNASGAVDVLDVRGAVGGDLRQGRHGAGDAVDVVEAEVDLALDRDGEDVQDRVGRAAHRDVHRHGVVERRPGRDRA